MVFGLQLSAYGLSVLRLSVILILVIRDVTDLEVYNLALEFLPLIYELANKLPLQHKRLKYQSIEAAEKIPPQIAEGFGKKKAPREFCRFLSMALGSSDEVKTHVREIKIVAQYYPNISQAECDNIIESYKGLSKRLNKLHTSWQRFT